jgi:hypothetical protein
MDIQQAGNVAKQEEKLIINLKIPLASTGLSF